MEEKLNCKICIAAKFAAAFPPCGQACCCQTCAYNPASVECLICRGDIVLKDKIFCVFARIVVVGVKSKVGWRVLSTG